MRGPDKDKWWKVCKDELLSQYQMETYVWVSRDDMLPGENVLPMQWRLVLKRDKHGRPLRYKARAYVQGNFQKMGDTLGETFAPVVSLATVMILLAVITLLDLEAHQWDLETAFLQAELDGDQRVFCRPPPKVHVPRDARGRPKVLRLLKSLYGLRISALALFSKMQTWFTENGYVSCISDCCLYVKREGTSFIIVATYVDDVLCCGNDIDMIKREEAKFFDTKNGGFKGESKGPIDHYIGIGIERDREARTMRLSQRGLIAKILETLEVAGASDDAIPDTPLPPGNLPGKRQPEEPEFQPPFEYRRVLGMLLFLARVTRPDLRHACHYLSRHAENPSAKHYEMLKRACLYLKGTAGDYMTYSRAFDQGVYMKVDASFGDCIDTAKSTTGVLVHMAGAVIVAVSKRQTVVASSSTHAEVNALKHGVSEFLFVLKILGFLGIVLPRPLMVFEDNQASIAIMTKLIKSLDGLVKHFRVRLMWAREHFQNGVLKLKYIQSLRNTADVLTKALPAALFRHHANVMLGIARDEDAERELTPDVDKLYGIRDIPEGGGEAMAYVAAKEFVQEATAEIGDYCLIREAHVHRAVAQTKRVETRRVATYWYA